MPWRYPTSTARPRCPDRSPNDDGAGSLAREPAPPHIGWVRLRSHEGPGLRLSRGRAVHGLDLAAVVGGPEHVTGRDVLPAGSVVNPLLVVRPARGRQHDLVPDLGHHLVRRDAAGSEFRVLVVVGRGRGPV